MVYETKSSQTSASFFSIHQWSREGKCLKPNDIQSLWYSSRWEFLYINPLVQLLYSLTLLNLAVTDRSYLGFSKVCALSNESKGLQTHSSGLTELFKHMVSIKSNEWETKYKADCGELGMLCNFDRYSIWTIHEMFDTSESPISTGRIHAMQTYESCSCMVSALGSCSNRVKKMNGTCTFVRAFIKISKTLNNFLAVPIQKR